MGTGVPEPARTSATHPPVAGCQAWAFMLCPAGGPPLCSLTWPGTTPNPKCPQDYFLLDPVGRRCLDGSFGATRSQTNTSSWSSGRKLSRSWGRGSLPSCWGRRGGVGETRGALKPGGIQGLQESPTLTQVCPEPNGKTLAGVCPLPLPLPLLRSREQQQQTHPNYKAGEGRSLQPRL